MNLKEEIFSGFKDLNNNSVIGNPIASKISINEFNNLLNQEGNYLEMTSDEWIRFIQLAITHVNKEGAEKFLSYIFNLPFIKENKFEILPNVDFYLYSSLFTQFNKNSFIVLELILSLCNKEKDAMRLVKPQYFKLIVDYFVSINLEHPEYTCRFLNNPYFIALLNRHEKKQKFDKNSLINSFIYSNKVYKIKENMENF